MSVDKEALFNHALELPVEERAAYLATACPDPDTRRSIQALLAADEKAEALLGPLDDAFIDPLLGKRVGSWRVLARIGEGGMSTVYRAVRDDGAFTMDAAVKVVRPALHSPSFLQRFQNEREVLARLRHPNIAQLLDGGLTEDGRPFLVMELVDGVSLQEWCNEHGLSVEDRIQLLLTVCEAVQIAHRNLIVHRDLKPSNVLVDQGGTVKLLDFGIAKVLEPEGSEPGAPVTHSYDRLFTPSYASPEQVNGEPVTTATDVYSLGVMAYQLLTGKAPYDVETSSPTEVARVICTTVPDRPSAVVLDAAVPESRDRWARRLAGDLDNIVLKALRKEPERRYASVEQFASDLRRHLEGHPVLARADTVGYRAGRFLKRNRAAALAAAVVFAVLLGGAAVSTALYVRAESSRRQAEDALAQARIDREQSDHIAAFLSDMLTAANPTETQSRDQVTVGEILDVASERVAVDLADQPAVAAGLYHTLGVTRRQLAQFDLAQTDLERSLAIRQTLGSPTEETIRTRFELGRTLTEAGKVDQALTVLLEAEGMADSLGADAADAAGVRADVLRALAEAHASHGTWDDAEASARKAVSVRRQSTNPDPEALAIDINQLGLMLNRQGRGVEAEPLLRESMDLLRGLKGETHSVVAQAASNLAWCLIGLNQFDEAIPLLESAIAVHRGVYAPDHPNLLAAQGNLARCYQATDRFAEARAINLDILEGFRATVGPEHPNFGHALNNLGFMLLDQGQLDEADSLFAQAVEVYQNALGYEHPYTAIALSNRARALRSAGRLVEAETVCLASLEIRRGSLRPDHPDIAGSAELLGRIRLDGNDPAGAEMVLREAGDVQRGSHPPTHGAVLTCDVLLARALTQMDRFPEAERLLLHSHAVYDTTTGAGEQLGQVREDLVVLYEAWGRPESAVLFAPQSEAVD